MYVAAIIHVVFKNEEPTDSYQALNKMRHTLIRRFTAETSRLRRKDADSEDPEERFVSPVPEPLITLGVSQLTHRSARKKSVQLLGKKILGSLNQ